MKKKTKRRRQPKCMNNIRSTFSWNKYGLWPTKQFGSTDTYPVRTFTLDLSDQLWFPYCKYYNRRKWPKFNWQRELACHQDMHVRATLWQYTCTCICSKLDLWPLSPTFTAIDLWPWLSLNQIGFGQGKNSNRPQTMYSLQIWYL